MTTASSNLDFDVVRGVDSAGQIDDILAMPDHITDALWRAESAQIAAKESERLVVCGLGGSAIGGGLAVAAIGQNARKPVHVVRDYDLPAWVGPESAVLCSSYSGNTEETLSCYEQAVDRGCSVYIASSGGLLSEKGHAAGQPLIGLPGILQPRASVAYMVIAVLEVGIATGAVDPAIRAQLEAAAVQLRERCGEWAPDSAGDSLAKRLARAGYGRVTVTYGADLTTPVAYRWKCQINENAKVPAWTAELPESNHNDINGWGGAAELAEHCVWFLRDADQNDRVKRRIELNAEVVEKSGAAVEIVDTIGDTRVGRLFSTILLGDLVSLYMATLREVDPSPVPVIEWLKDSLGRPS